MSGILNTLNLLLQNPVVVDVETTVTNKGNAFTKQNKLVTIQLKQRNSPPIILTKENFSDAIPILSSASVVIGSNLKFDLHWLQRELDYKASCVWCCQLAEFIFSKQTWKYPDLATMCVNYGAQPKIDVVKTEYWDKGIDTTEIPFDILAEYGAGDVESTMQVFEKQVERFKTTQQHQFKLFRVHCNDLLVLQEMEYNGIKYDVDKSLEQADTLVKQVNHLEEKLYAFTGGVPINFDSRDHVSVLLYGGKIVEETRVPIGVYKTGAKVGQPRYSIVPKEYKLEPIVVPLKGSELKKAGYYSTEESTLLSLKPNATAKKVITWLLERSKLMKLKSTYLEGLPKVINTYEWEDNLLHSNLNNCLAVTGRLSSSKPNQQNLPKEAKRHCITRY